VRLLIRCMQTLILCTSRDCRAVRRLFVCVNPGFVSDSSVIFSGSSVIFSGSSEVVSDSSEVLDVERVKLYRHTQVLSMTMLWVSRHTEVLEVERVKPALQTEVLEVEMQKVCARPRQEKSAKQVLDVEMSKVCARPRQEKSQLQVLGVKPTKLPRLLQVLDVETLPVSWQIHVLNSKQVAESSRLGNETCFADQKRRRSPKLKSKPNRQSHQMLERKLKSK